MVKPVAAVLQKLDVAVQMMRFLVGQFVARPNQMSKVRIVLVRYV
jgi:hypothetical protein